MFYDIICCFSMLSNIGRITVRVSMSRLETQTEICTNLIIECRHLIIEVVVITDKMACLTKF